MIPSTDAVSDETDVIRYGLECIINTLIPIIIYTIYSAINHQINDMIVSLTSGDRYYISDSGAKYDIGFDIYIPDDTIAFCDNLVMTKNAQHKDLGYKFIDFMTSRSFTYKNSEDEVNPSLTNTYYVDYDAVFNDVYDELVDMKTTTIDQAYKDEFEGSKSEFNSYLYDTIYDIGIGIGFDKYYPRDELKGSILANFSRSYIKEINKTFNNART
jgi:spermidine/putrescine-binding protein